MVSMTAGRILTTLALLIAVSLASACGRRGPLDTPYEAQVQARKDAEKNGEPLPPEPVKPEADRPFILDKLL